MAMNTTSLQINISKRSLCFLPLMDHQSTDRGNLGGYRPPCSLRASWITSFLFAQTSV